MLSGSLSFSVAPKNKLLGFSQVIEAGKGKLAGIPSGGVAVGSGGAAAAGGGGGDSGEAAKEEEKKEEKKEESEESDDDMGFGLFD